MSWKLFGGGRPKGPVSQMRDVKAFLPGPQGAAWHAVTK